MCRWLAYSGNPVNVAHLILGGTNSIVGQSLESHRGAEPTNGDGFGVGWWADQSRVPSRYRSIEPAWNNDNLREITGQLHSRMVMMHVRAAIGSQVQLTNCHPFRHHETLFVHNGFIGGFEHVRRQLLMDVDPALFNHIDGTADSEVLFHLALGYGLAKDPKAAMELATGHVIQALEDAGIEPELQLSIGIGDGTNLWAVRFSTIGEPRTLYASRDYDTVAALYPKLPALGELSRESRVIVSEPVNDLEGIWEEIPPSSFVHAYDGQLIVEPFAPRVAAGVAR